MFRRRIYLGIEALLAHEMTKQEFFKQIIEFIEYELTEQKKSNESKLIA